MDGNQPLGSIKVEASFSFSNDLCYEAWFLLDLVSPEGPNEITVLCEAGLAWVLSLSVKNMTMR